MTVPRQNYPPSHGGTSFSFSYGLNSRRPQWLIATQEGGSIVRTQASRILNATNESSVRLSSHCVDPHPPSLPLVSRSGEVSYPIHLSVVKETPSNTTVTSDQSTPSNSLLSIATSSSLVDRTALFVSIIFSNRLRFANGNPPLLQMRQRWTILLLPSVVSPSASLVPQCSLLDQRTAMSISSIFLRTSVVH
jgi:hypothetical protein